GIGVAGHAHKRILLSAQAGRTARASVQKPHLRIAVKEMRYMDSYAVHFGIQGVITKFLLLRLGWSLDSNAIPDSTLRRENEDALKSTIAAGFGLHFWKILLAG